MTRHGRRSRMLVAGNRLPAIGALAICAVSACGSAAGAVSPLPASDYAVQPVCRPVPRGARCLSSTLVPVTAAARARSHPSAVTAGAQAGRGATGLCGEAPHEEAPEAGWSPCRLHEAYVEKEHAETTPPPTIAIVDAFNDPTALEDLKTYSKFFGLKQCAKKEHCFTQVNQLGQTSPLPPDNGEWAEEISLDIEAAHAICTDCHILLVEAQSQEWKDLEAAEDEAAAQGATVISDSWADPELTADSPAFDHPGIVITASAGDEGFLNWTGEANQKERPLYPASSPHVVAVGGTRLTYAGGEWQETVWNGEFPGNGERGAGGSGCSERFTAPYWQRELPDWDALGCGSRRAVADISADADPYTGIAVYDSTKGLREPGWRKMGGTSLASPLIAAMFALAGGSNGVEYPARTLYENARLEPESVHDVQSGSNGVCEQIKSGWGTETCSVGEEGTICSESPICVAGPGYDGPSGLGTPAQLALFEPTGAPVKGAQQLHFTSTAPAGARIGEGSYTVTAAATSGLSVGFSSPTPSVCELQGASVMFLAAGRCTLVASQGGDAEYQPALPVEQSFTVAKDPQSITFTSSAASATVGGPPYTPSASASSGLSVSFSSSTPGVCSVEGSSVSFVGPGTCTIAADQPGSQSFEAAPEVSQSFTVTAAPQLAPELPGAPSGGPGSSSETLSFTTTPTPTPSSLAVVGRPRVNSHTGGVTFVVSVSGAGTLSWLLTFRNGNLGAVRAGASKFADGHMRTTGPGKVTFTARPGALAREALRAAAARKKQLKLQATLTFLGTSAGKPVSQTRVVADRVLH